MKMEVGCSSGTRSILSFRVRVYGLSLSSFLLLFARAAG